MKEVGTSSWYTPNTEATNTSLFTGVPGGFRYNDAYYAGFGDFGYWWSSSEFNTAWIRSLNYYSGVANRGINYKNYGFSVRCLRD